MRIAVIRGQRGLTLIELMISMVIGLIMVGAMLLAYLSNTATERSMLATSHLQENARFAFEYLARDIREAGSLPCGLQTPIANVLNSASGNGGAVDWADFDDLMGFEGNESVASLDAFSGGYGERVAGTDALRLSINNGAPYSIESHNPSSAQFKFNEAGHALSSGDIVFVCDYEQSAIFQVTNANASNATIVHNTGTGTPGNCTKGLGSPVACTTNGTPHSFAENGIVVGLTAASWYVGCNLRADCATPAGRSLFFTRLNGATLLPQDLVEGVVDFQLRYLSRTGNSYVDANAVTNWDNVVGVEVLLTLEESGVGVGTNNRDIQRTFDFAIAVRGRL